MKFCHTQMVFGLIGLMVALSGCASLRATDPGRTATEQFLLSEAAVEAVSPLSFDALRGRKVFIEDAYFAPSEKEFVLGEFRAKLLLSGIQIKDQKSDAEIIIEIRSSGVGIDRYESLIGIPSIFAPPVAAGAASGGTAMTSVVTPELAITKKRKQVGFASVSYVAYWAETGEVVSSSGPSVGRTLREDFWFLGFGPRSVGNIAPVDNKVKK